MVFMEKNNKFNPTLIIIIVIGIALLITLLLVFTGGDDETQPVANNDNQTQDSQDSNSTDTETGNNEQAPTTPTPTPPALPPTPTTPPVDNTADDIDISGPDNWDSLTPTQKIARNPFDCPVEDGDIHLSAETGECLWDLYLNEEADDETAERAGAYVEWTEAGQEFAHITVAEEVVELRNNPDIELIIYEDGDDVVKYGDRVAYEKVQSIRSQLAQSTLTAADEGYYDQLPKIIRENGGTVRYVGASTIVWSFFIPAE